MKQITPMKMLKPELTQMKNLSGFSFFELNRKKGGYDFVCEDLYYSKPVTFDYMLIIGNGELYRNEKGHVRYKQSISLAFDFKDTNPSVRAGISILNNVDYSKKYTVDEARNKIHDFLKNPTIEDFVSIFEIRRSSTVSKSEIRDTVKNLVSKVTILKKQINKLDKKSSDLRSFLIKYPDVLNDKQKLLEVIEERKEKQKEINSIYSDGLKDLPYIIRHHFCNEYINPK